MKSGIVFSGINKSFIRLTVYCLTMPCSICRVVGHNILTCSMNNGIQRVPKKKKEKQKVNLKKPPLTQGKYSEMLQKMKETRKNQYDLANECVQSLINGKNVSIIAEEKSGKRIIMECIHLIQNINHTCGVETQPRSVYITALNRKDTKPQFEEQESFGITSIVATKSNELLGEIVKIMNEPDDSKVYIHLDECDYGTGNTQSLSKLYLSPELETHRDRIKFITYSATPQEVILSEKIDEPQWAFHEFIPHESYFGAHKYIEQGLVFEPHTFFNGAEFTNHGSKIANDIYKLCEGGSNKRNIIVVRDTKPKNLGLIKRKKLELEEKYKCEIYVYDQHEPFEWGNPQEWAKMGRGEIKDDNEEIIGYFHKPVIVFISQICTRSTEICPLGHRRLYAWHDARLLSDKKAFNTLSQAIGRVKHYSQTGHPENNIKLYCDIDILNYTLGKELKKTEKKDMVVALRVGKTIIKDKKNIFNGFDDNYENIFDVPPSEWMTCKPSGRATYYSVDGKWCHYDKKVRYFNDLPPGSTNHEQYKNVLQYESSISNRYIIRKAKFVENPDYTGENKVDFKTNKNSMYS